VPDTPDLDALLANALRGDQASLVTLLEQLGPRVRAKLDGKITGPLQSSLDIDDVMQVTYLEACMRLNRFRQGGVPGFLAWLSRMAENNLIDAVRALESAKRPGPSKRIVPTNPQESMIAFVELLGATSTTPSRVTAKDEAARHLNRSLTSLPPDYEKVVRLYDLEGKSITEVAAALGRSEGACWMLRARAHDRLREAMGPIGNFFSTPA
jgi:RNA polymerase sigma factor (sigma-70 family)